MTGYKYLNDKQPNKYCVKCVGGWSHYECSRVDTEDPIVASCAVDGCNNMLTNYKMSADDQILIKNVIFIYCDLHREDMRTKWTNYRIQDKKEHELSLDKNRQKRQALLEKIERIREYTKSKWYKKN